MVNELLELESLYNLSVEFEKNFGKESLKKLKNYYPNEIEEREKINQIILNPTQRIGNKIERILIIQEFSTNSKLFHLDYETLLSVLISQNDGIPPTKSEITRIDNLQDLIFYIKNDLITKKGIEEKYPNFSYLKKYIIGNPLEFYIKTKKYFSIMEMVKSSDVLESIKKIKKIRLNTFLKECQNVTYLEFKEKRKNWEAINKNKHKELNDFELSHKFKIDNYCFNYLKKLKRKNQLNLSSLEINELLELQNIIAPIYWDRINKFLWNSFTKELKSLRREKNKERFNTRLNVFLQRYNFLPKDRILKLLHV